MGARGQGGAQRERGDAGKPGHGRYLSKCGSAPGRLRRPVPGPMQGARGGRRALDALCTNRSTVFAPARPSNLNDGACVPERDFGSLIKIVDDAALKAA